jgi:hypothetical protein
VLRLAGGGSPDDFGNSHVFVLEGVLFAAEGLFCEEPDNVSHLNLEEIIPLNLKPKGLSLA